MPQYMVSYAIEPMGLQALHIHFVAKAAGINSFLNAWERAQAPEMSHPPGQAGVC